MSPPRRWTRARRSPVGGRHAWLELLATTGPFVTAPVLDRALPDGPPAAPRATRARLRDMVADVLDRAGAGRHQLITATLADGLDWGDHLRTGHDLPDALAETITEHNLVLRPDLAFYAEADEKGKDAADTDLRPLGGNDPDPATEGSDPTGLINEGPTDDTEDESGDDLATTLASPWRLLGMISPWGAHPLTRLTVDGWAASPVERLAALLRARDAPIGIVTDGRWWTLVWAPRGGTIATATWDATLWTEEPETFDGFAALLARSRFLAEAVPDRLPALLVESLARQEEITETLGRQVRNAVATLVGALDALDAESGRTLLAGVSDDDLYDGAVTFLMRLVFLLFAEERRLLPSDDDLYLDGYAAGRLVETLEDRAALAGEADLEHRTSAWNRLLAVSRAVHAGIAHEDLRLPGYGGGLFDPDRFAWLEGRQPGDPPSTTPPRVDDRTVLAMLRAVQFVEIGGQRRRLSFRSLDVEQIGYVYEGLLELEVRTATEPTLLLARLGTKKPKHQAEVPATVWAEGLDDLTPAEQETWLAERTGTTSKRAQAILDAKPSPDEAAALRRACGGDADLAEIATPLLGALRTDDRGQPAIALTGARYLGPSTRRAATGAHYTPRALATDIVANTLEPLVYRPGPLETSKRNEWRLRPSTEILALRVADIAMGSGAFLVAADRYLADRLVEAWDAEGRADATRAVRRRQGRPLATDAEVDDVLLDARRLVAEHCLYGVDINPLAVEMAKLSLWLITMDRERPFGFLDDRLRAGDSLLGLVNVDQLETLHVDPVAGRLRSEGRLFDATHQIRRRLAEAADLRRRITAQPVTSLRDVEHKASLLAESEALTGHLHTVADAICAEGLLSAGRRPAELRTRFTLLADRVAMAESAEDDIDLRREADIDLQTGRPLGTAPRLPLHWPLTFPEVFADTADPGFDAIVGNPPFLGGKKLSGHLGDDYRRWLQAWDGRGIKGNGDLVAFFVLRADRLLGQRGQLGYVAVNTLVEGETLEVGLLQTTQRGLTIRRSQSGHPWPSRSANLQIVELWASRAALGPDASCWLDGEDVLRIGPDLEPVGKVTGRPRQLRENNGLAFQGTNVLGLGFTLTHEQAAEIILLDPHNAEVIQPYVIGRDLNQRPDCSASRHIINFREWSIERCREYPEPFSIVERTVRPDRMRHDRTKYPRMVDEWWKFWQNRTGLDEALNRLHHVLALSLVGNVLLPVRVPTGPVFAHKCGVFAIEDFASLTLLSSDVHSIWAIRYTSTMRIDINYSPSDVFLTLPRPTSTPNMEVLGEQLDSERRTLMLSRSWGLTTTYNHVHDPTDHDPQIVGLRAIHAAIDRAVFDAYGWTDLDPEVGHYPTKIGVRWTVSPAARFEILDRLLAENHRRHDAETS
jgi:hypothetical protein